MPTLFSVFVLLTPVAAAAQEAPAGCPPYEGVTCEGWVTDEAGALSDPAGLEELVDSLVAEFGHEIAVVIVTTTGGLSPQEFAEGLGNTWGVGTAGENDGVVVLVAVNDRETWVATGEGVDLSEAAIAPLGNSYFGNGDFDRGVSSILGGIASSFEAQAQGEPDPFDGSSNVAPIFIIAGLAGAALVVTNRAARRKEQSANKSVYEHRVDDILARLKPAGHELNLQGELFLERPIQASPMASAPVHAALLPLMETVPVSPDNPEALHAAWATQLVDVLDADRVAAERKMPLELAISGEQDLLEKAVQQSARDAIGVKKELEFNVAIADLERLVTSLRPYRVSEARQRRARQLSHASVDSGIGAVILTDLGTRFMQASPVLDLSQPITETVNEVQSAYESAVAKTAQLGAIHEALDEGPARPAVAVALVDLESAPQDSLTEFHKVEAQLAAYGEDLAGLSIPAVAAFLLLNNDGDDVDAFLEAFRQARQLGSEPGEAVEFAMAGLRTPSEIKEIREQSEHLGLPVAITAALVRRGGEALADYETTLQELTRYGVGTEDRSTIAALLTISLEPAQAIRRWIEAREALSSLGLVGAYADTAAAFGASDPRGPKTFALAYAAQRQALARSPIDDADRYAPELASSGTGRQRDTWTGQPLPRGIGVFDPFTFLYHRWVITGGTGYGHGWNTIYGDSSWSGDSSSWFGGGSFGDGDGGGSSWGGGFGGGGGFSGFGGGGGFGGGFGGFGGGGGGGSSW